MSVSIVVQRFRKCKLLLNEEQWVTVGDDSENSGSCGLLAYISFGSSTTQSEVEAAAQTLLNLPVLTTGLWGDSSSTQSILGLATASISSCSLVIVPQANLISKVKGKSIQYHGQIDKDLGEQLYDYFCSYIQGLLLEGQCKARSEDLPEWYIKRKTFLEQQQQSKKSYSPSTPPDEMFRDASKYSEWDEKGIPTKDSEGNALTKSGMKKLTKLHEAHRKKHIKWKEEQQKSGDDCASEQTLPSSVAAEAPPVEQWDGCLDDTFCHFVKGSFGKRQGLEFTSDMGPFVHSFQV
eukprot:scaffold4605_cov150-Skeletonema_dohrnii-CCMP3373.AAC.2